MRKKGISSVVTSILLVLLALAGVAIMWGFLKPLFSGAGKNINTDSFTVRLSILPNSVCVNKLLNLVTLTVKRDSGAGDVVGFNVILQDKNGKRYTKKIEGEIKEFETKSAAIDYTTSGLKDITKISISPILSGQNKENPNHIADSYVVSSELFALRFNGLDNYINISTLSPIQNKEINAFTFVAWINATGDTGEIQQIFEGHTSTWEIFLEGRFPGNLSFLINDMNGNGQIAYTKNLLLNRWYQVVGTYNGSMQKVYIDSELQDSLFWSDNFKITTGIKIAKDYELDIQYFNGVIDNVRIYERALSSKEISQLYDCGPDGNILTNNLVGWWKFDEGSGDIVKDDSKNRNNGKIVGATWVST